jgi:hypothetical protein
LEGGMGLVGVEAETDRPAAKTTLDHR